MESINDFFASRRTVRSFKHDAVDSEEMERFLLLAANAPTTGNMQLCCAVVSDGDVKKELEPAHFNQPAATGAPVLVTFCADFNLFGRWCGLNGTRADFRNSQGLLMGVFDAVIFAQQFVSVAEANGYGTCYLGTTTYNLDRIAEVLELPEGVIPLLTVAVGKPAEQPENPGRLPLGAVVHMQKYSPFSDEDVRVLYAEKESRADSKMFVAENSKENLAQVFAEVRYPGAMLREFSAKLEGYLRAKFFKSRL